MMKSLYSFLFGILFSVSVYGQDPLFSQSTYIIETINPGFSGFEDSGRSYLGLIHRTQWPNLDLKINTQYFFWNESFDYGDRLGFGLGMSALHHSESFTNYSLSQINFNYAHRVNLNNGWYFRPAIELGIGYKDFAFGNLLLSDQININTGTINSSSIDPYANIVENIFFFDVSTGYVFERKVRNGINYWIGISAKHLNRPNISFVDGENLPLDIFYSFHGNIRFPFLRDSDVQLVGNFMQQGQFNRFDFGPLFYLNNRVLLGLNLVTNPAKNNGNNQLLTSVNGFVGLEYDNFRFGLSYDYNTTKIGQTYGVYEFSVTYLSRCRNCYTDRKRKR